jgi:hypothetical protein
VVDDRPSNAKKGVGSELVTPLGIEAFGRLDQSEEAGGHEILLERQRQSHRTHQVANHQINVFLIFVHERMLLDK